MSKFKKALCVLLSMLFVAGCFAGCSSKGEAEKITDKTMLIAYSEENEPEYEKDGRSGNGSIAEA